MGTFVFAAVATPSTDPFSMLMLAIPMLVLVLSPRSSPACIDRRRGRAAATSWDDDAASPL